MKVTGKLAFVIVILVASIVFVFATTSPAQRGSGLAYGQGWMSYKFGNYLKGVKHFTRAYDKDQNNLMALYFKTFCEVRLGETSQNSALDKNFFSEAAFDAKELIDKGKKTSHKNLYLFYYVKARAHANLKQWDAAEKNIELARKIENNEYRILVLAGRIMIGKEEFHQALVYLDDAVAIKNVRAAEAYLYMGIANEGLRRTDKAYFYYKKCLNAWPSKDVKREAMDRKTNIYKRR